MPKLTLTVVSQERALMTESVDAVTATTTSGEITILPGHIPLFTKLTTGELRYQINKQEESIVISKGFLTVAPNNEITVMADVAVHERDISEEKAAAAIKAAEETLTTSADQRERILAEASLRRAMLEIRIAQRTKRTKI